MRAGDLIKMKYEMWWTIQSRKDYVSDIGLVFKTEHNAVWMMLPDGLIRRDLIEHWEVMSEL